MIENKEQAKKNLVEYYGGLEDLKKAIQNKKDIEYVIRKNSFYSLNSYNYERLKWFSKEMKEIYKIEDIYRELIDFNVDIDKSLYKFIEWIQYIKTISLFNEVVAELKKEL